MEIYQIIMSAFTTIFSIGLLLVSLGSYLRYRNFKLLFVSMVFLVLFIKGILLTVALFNETFATVVQPFLSNGLFDLVILIFLFIATLKR